MYIIFGFKLQNIKSFFHLRKISNQDSPLPSVNEKRIQRKINTQDPVINMW